MDDDPDPEPIVWATTLDKLETMMREHLTDLGYM